VLTGTAGCELPLLQRLVDGIVLTRGEPAVGVGQHDLPGLAVDGHLEVADVATVALDEELSEQPVRAGAVLGVDEVTLDLVGSGLDQRHLRLTPVGGDRRRVRDGGQVRDRARDGLALGAPIALPVAVLDDGPAGVVDQIR
jgi:hypothetical protein